MFVGGANCVYRNDNLVEIRSYPPPHHHQVLVEVCVLRLDGTDQKVMDKDSGSALSS